MKNKKMVIILPIILLIAITAIIYYNNNFINAIYEIKVEEIEDKSPDRRLIVLKNGKEITKYKYIKYNDDKNIVLCKVENPTVNKFEIIDVDELIVVLSNNKEVIAKIKTE